MSTASGRSQSIGRASDQSNAVLNAVLSPPKLAVDEVAAEPAVADCIQGTYDDLHTGTFKAPPALQLNSSVKRATYLHSPLPARAKKSAGQSHVSSSVPSSPLQPNNVKDSKLSGKFDKVLQAWREARE